MSLGSGSLTCLIFSNACPVVSWSYVKIEFIHLTKVGKAIIAALSGDFSDGQISGLDHMTGKIHLSLGDPFFAGTVFHDTHNVADIIRGKVQIVR